MNLAFNIKKNDKYLYEVLKKFHNTKLQSVVKNRDDSKEIIDEYYLHLLIQTNLYTHNRIKSSAKINEFIG